MNLYLPSTAGYSVGFLRLAVEVVVHLRVRRGRIATAETHLSDIDGMNAVLVPLTTPVHAERTARLR